MKLAPRQKAAVAAASVAIAAQAVAVGSVAADSGGNSTSFENRAEQANACSLLLVR